MRTLTKSVGIIVAASALVGYVAFAAARGPADTWGRHNTARLSRLGESLSVDATKDVIRLPMSDAQDAAFQPNGVDRMTLQRNTRYTVTAVSGEAYMSSGDATSPALTTDSMLPGWIVERMMTT